MAPRKKDLTATDFNPVVVDSVEVSKKARRYYAKDCNSYVFFIEVLDGNGKPIYETDRYGNNSTLKERKFEFTRCPVINEETGKTDARKHLSTFIIDDSEGAHLQLSDPDCERVIAILEEKAAKKGNPIVTEEQYNRERNPEAARLVDANRHLQKSLEQIQRENEELKELLGKA